jgi:hypothetical protein
MAEIAGLKLIVPSSVAGSGVSVSASGKVTFTAATSISINGCFSSSYDNYLMVINFDANSDDLLSCRLRSSGTDSSANYVRQWIDANGTSVTGFRNAGTTNAFHLGYHGQDWNGSAAYFYGPALAQPTALRSVNVASVSGARILDSAGTHSLSTAYDGCTVLSTSGVAYTGALTIYGLAN